MMKERSERALRQVEYLKADLYYNLLSCLAVSFFPAFWWVDWGFFYQAGIKEEHWKCRNTVSSLQSLLSNAHVWPTALDSPCHCLASHQKRESQAVVPVNAVLETDLTQPKKITLAKSLAVWVSSSRILLTWYMTSGKFQLFFLRYPKCEFLMEKKRIL